MTLFEEVTDPEMFEAMIGHDEMTLDEYQDKASSFIFYKGSLLYPTLGLTGEAGEVAEKVKKLYRDDEVNFMRDDMVEELSPEQARNLAFELGDVMFYIAAIAGDIGYSLEEIADMNISKLTDRQHRNALSGSGDHR